MITDYMPGPYPVPNLYKVVGADGAPLNGGTGAWPLPTADAPGAWRTIDGDIRPCINGLHVTSAADLHHWLTRGAMVYRVETDGPVYDTGQKYVARRVRLLPGPISADTIAPLSDRFRTDDIPKPTAKTRREEWLLTYGASLPARHPMRAKYDKLTAAHMRRVDRARAKHARDVKKARATARAWFGDDASTMRDYTAWTY